MNRYILQVLFAIAGPQLVAQQIPMQTFISGGAGTFQSGTVASFGIFGQPMVMPRITATSSGGGVAVAADLMFSDIAIDNNAPVFVGTPTITVSKATGGITGTLSANATDAESTPRVYMYHRPVAGGGTYDSTQLTGSGPFTLDLSTLNASEYDNMGVEYYLKAFDSKPNVTRHPASGTLFGRMTDPNAQVPANLLSYGSSVSNYRIIGIPYTLTGSITQVFTDIGPADKSKYRIFRYEPSQNYAEGPGDFNTIERGKGYFIIQAGNRSDIVLKMGSQQAPANHRNNLYQISLHDGWNLIGNPYTVPINWDNVKAFTGNNGGALGQLKVYGSGSFSNATQLEAFQGAFVNVTGSQTITIPFLGQTTPGGREKPEFVTDLSQPNWKTGLTLSQGELVNQLSEFGMHPVASVQFDETDDFNPPSLFGFAEINFPHPEHRYGSFASDIVNPQPEYVWRFNADVSQPYDAELSWNNALFGNNNLELYLYDVQTNRVINMREDNRYVFAPEQSKQFKIYYGVDIRERIGPDEVQVLAPYPNPFGLKQPVTISIGLPENPGNQKYAVNLVIRNSMGQQVYAYGDQLSPGIHNLTWDGRRPDGEGSSQGFYVYTVRAGNRTFTGKILFLNSH
ncbi:hypothetical protein QQ054_36740 [Oscillatoria amoena NRMC-F 0135]|nr:hypothetical protein [Oscillatoria amoena NRMC-F 0135]